MDILEKDPVEEALLNRLKALTDSSETYSTTNSSIKETLDNIYNHRKRVLETTSDCVQSIMLNTDPWDISPRLLLIRLVYAILGSAITLGVIHAFN